MARPAPEAVARIACIGCGLMGGGWVVHFLARGYDVVAWDPAEGIEKRLRATVAAAWPLVAELGLARGADPGRLSFAASPEEAVAGAHFVQESATEKLDLKQALFARLDAASDPDLVIATSTSGLLMTDIQRHAARPGRMVVGHPFNPTYLVPLVEVVGGERTDEEAVDWAAAFYARAGKAVLRMAHEVPGFIANRLQEAVWREAKSLIAEGSATAEQIDLAMTAGPGLRWALFGPMAVAHMAGGPGGIAHMLAQFDPSVRAPWGRGPDPAMTPELMAALKDGCARLAAGRPVEALAAERDRKLVALLKLLARG